MQAQEIAGHLAAVQFRLKELYGTGSYYTSTYADQELGYCGMVPYWLARYINLLPGAKVLDIGPGYGTLAAFCSRLGAKVTTLDKTDYLSYSMRGEYDIKGLLGDVEIDDIWDKYHFIIMTEVLEHFNYHPVPTLTKIKSALLPDGRLFLSTPDADTWGRVNIYKDIDSIPPYDPTRPLKWRDEHIWQYSRQELEDVVITAGLKLLEITHSNSPGGNHFNVVLRAI